MKLDQSGWEEQETSLRRLVGSHEASSSPANFASEGERPLCSLESARESEFRSGETLCGTAVVESGGRHDSKYLCNFTLMRRKTAGCCQRTRSRQVNDEGRVAEGEGELTSRFFADERSCEVLRGSLS